jgi:tRNA uridine 5-carbamoylmethylation protein Kti12
MTDNNHDDGPSMDHDHDHDDFERLARKYSKVLVVDDTMHLRSMRREVYMRARDVSHIRNAAVTLLTVFVQTSAALTRTRNATRRGVDRVADDAMDRIEQTFEGPAESLIFDRQHVVCALEDEKRFSPCSYC